MKRSETSKSRASKFSIRRSKNYRKKLSGKKLSDEKFAVLENRMEEMSRQLEALTEQISVLVKQSNTPQPRSTASLAEQLSEQVRVLRANVEQSGEQTEQVLSAQWRPSKSSELNRIRGRHREILAMLINNGYHTYQQISDKLNISQSRARAYIAELRNRYNVPLHQIRDPEGYKVGIDVRFVERILSVR